MTAGVYEILNTANGKRYIGSSANVFKRLKEHENALRRGAHHSILLQRAWDKYGAAVFVPGLLLICAPARDALALYEQLCFDALSPAYNIAPVACSTLGTKRTPEQCARNGELKRGNKNALGQKRTPEQCENNAAAQRGKKLSVAHRENISAGGKGIPKPPAWRAAMSKIHTGKKYGPQTEEHRQKISRGNAGQTRTEEQRANISAGLRAAWARRRTPPK